MGTAWNDWFHVTIHVYGAWLRGDPRGWRSQHHREHVEGDYNDPPPKGTYDKLLAKSKALMKRPAVRIADDLTQIVLRAIVEKLQQEGIEIIAAAVDGLPVHLLGRFADHRPRHWVGRAKLHASHLLRQRGLRTDAGGLWAKKSYAKPIRDRRHQVEVFRYILGHEKRGAAVWRFDWPIKAEG